MGWHHPRQTNLQPPYVTVQVLRGRTTEGLDERVIASVKRVHVLDMIASCGDARAGFVAYHEVFNSAVCCRYRLTAGAIRAEDGIRRQEGLYSKLQGRTLAVR